MTDSDTPKPRFVKGHQCNTLYSWAESVKANGVVLSSQLMDAINTIERQERELRDLRLKYQQLSFERDVLVEDVANRGAWQQRARGWMRHTGSCLDNIVGGYDYPCSCGLDDFLKETQG